MTFKDIHEFIISLKQDLIIEELLIEEYSEVISNMLTKDGVSTFLTKEEKQEVSQIVETLKSDSLKHKDAIMKLIDEATTQGLREYITKK